MAQSKGVAKRLRAADSITAAAVAANSNGLGSCFKQRSAGTRLPSPQAIATESLVGLSSYSRSARNVPRAR